MVAAAAAVAVLHDRAEKLMAYLWNPGEKERIDACSNALKLN